MIGCMWGMAPRYIEGGHRNNRVQQKKIHRTCVESMVKKVAIATECGLEEVHGMMGSGV